MPYMVEETNGLGAAARGRKVRTGMMKNTVGMARRSPQALTNATKSRPTGSNIATSAQGSYQGALALRRRIKTPVSKLSMFKHPMRFGVPQAAIHPPAVQATIPAAAQAPVQNVGLRNQTGNIKSDVNQILQAAGYFSPSEVDPVILATLQGLGYPGEGLVDSFKAASTTTKIVVGAGVALGAGLVLGIVKMKRGKLHLAGLGSPRGRRHRRYVRGQKRRRGRRLGR